MQARKQGFLKGERGVQRVENGLRAEKAEWDSTEYHDECIFATPTVATAGRPSGCGAAPLPRAAAVTESAKTAGRLKSLRYKVVVRVVAVAVLAMGRSVDVRVFLVVVVNINRVLVLRFFQLPGDGRAAVLYFTRRAAHVSLD